MVLKHLHLSNFQAHAKLELEVSPTITSIVGATDAGKSAILRALRWLALNDRAGTEFIREGQKEVEVEALFLSQDETPLTITRKKNKEGTTNTYQLDDREFKSFGQGVPDEVQSFLGLTEVNFQDQHDAPFWFCETAGEVSKRLNTIINLSIIDQALGEIAGKVRTAKERHEWLEEELKKAEDEQRKIQPQKKRIAQFKQLEDLHEIQTTSRKDADSLADLVAKIHSNKAKEHAERAADGEGLLTAARLTIVARRRHIGMKAKLEEAETLRQIKPPPDFTPILDLRAKSNQSHTSASKLQSLLKRTEAARSRCIEAERELKQSEQTFHTKTKGASCPLCGSRLS